MDIPGYLLHSSQLRKGDIVLYSGRMLGKFIPATTNFQFKRFHVVGPINDGLCDIRYSTLLDVKSAYNDTYVWKLISRKTNRIEIGL